MKPFGIAGIQMTIGHGSNVDALEQRLAVLMHLYPWLDMVLFSELAAFGPLHQYAEPMPGATEQRFQAMAQEHGIWLLPGSAFEQDGDSLYNTAAVIDPEGNVIARHRKMFPFCPFESGVEAGEDFVLFDVPGAGRFGVCICYDMWYPEVTRTLTSMGAEVILHPVLTGTNDRDIELSLARSTAAQFQTYVFDINGLGVGGVGQSCIVDPSGRVVHQAGTVDEFLVTEIDFDKVRREREVGLRSLGQTLKSFRDCRIDFPVYNRENSEARVYLENLGAMRTPQRGDRDILAPVPASVGPALSRQVLSSYSPPETDADGD